MATPRGSLRNRTAEFYAAVDAAVARQSAGAKGAKGGTVRLVVFLAWVGTGVPCAAAVALWCRWSACALSVGLVQLGAAMGASFCVVACRRA